MITPEEAVANVERYVKDRQWEREWINKEFGGLPVAERAHQIHCLFEGLCPTCGSKVILVRVGGVPKFLEEMQFIGNHEIQVWETAPELGDNGGVEFECKNGHEHYVGYSFSSGDWH